MATDKNIRRADGSFRGSGERAPTAPLSTNNSTGPPEPLLTEVEVARIMGLTVKALQARRQRGLPPAYVKLGSGKRAPVRYRQSVIYRLIEAGTRTSTSDPGTPATS
jgi:hypothetical protein